METIKEEKKDDLEQLLNSLIEKGWLPFGEWCHRSPYKKVHIHKNYNKERTYALFYSNNHTHWKVLRQLVSRESWLWQFVCENKMEKKMEKNHRWIWINSWAKSAYQSYPVYTMERYEYRLIESSLKDESELEDFLLSNIKIEWQ